MTDAERALIDAVLTNHLQFLSEAGPAKQIFAALRRVHAERRPPDLLERGKRVYAAHIAANLRWKAMESELARCGVHVDGSFEHFEDWYAEGVRISKEP